MKEFFNWCLLHWKIIITCLSMVFSFLGFLVVLIKKPKMVNSALQEMFMRLPEFIIEAEHSFYNGISRYSYVFNKCVDLLVASLGLDYSTIVQRYASVIRDAIENILATPQKKED